MPCLQGEQHPSHKLTAEDVLAIRGSYIPGVITLADLANSYSVSKQTVSEILNGRSWRWLIEGTS